ncbi:hypothetical protein KPL71_001158 [Citrus sinensis]|uniref:Uncharacterized protein n=1 Tax=Citrus sinensis TaxID=2711 RepID=A0ACB8NVA8_CITSI|nr:hypothetical protein KPL71_001158 [Citrus sinensis]
MPLEWLTNYEQFHQNSEPVQTSQAIFERRSDGQVKMSFQTLDKPSPDPPRLSYIAMITAVSTVQEPNLPIYGFSSNGYPVYPDKVNSHFLWDVPEAHMCNPDCPCLDDTDDDEDFEIMRRRRRKKKPFPPKTPCWPYLPGPPDDPKSDQPLPIYKKPLRQLQRESSFKPVHAQLKIKPCLIFSSSSQSYQESFPPLERHTDTQTKVVSQPYVQSPITTSGALEAPKQYEAVLNWQTQNASAQNQALHHLEPDPFVPPVSEKSSRPSSSPWFTFDDIPRHKWQARHQEFATWIDVQMTSLTVQSERVLQQFEKVDHTAFILIDSTDSDPDDISVISTIQEINHIRPTLPGPSVKISVIPSKFHKLVSVIDFLDTGAQRSMLNPKILPLDYWDNHTEYFRAANGKVFETSLITKKPIDTAPPYPSISQKFLELCPEDHSHFTHPSPLWKNTQFFIHLPFKLNEDVNPTKATHLGMPPSDLTLAKQECTQLLRQGLIEPTTSYWACQAFYVEKRSELVRGKKRLVIDYQPLNAFLKDDKFPLPKIQSLFIHLPGAKWTVLPFGLKVAPSLFQKAMVKIFSPILHHALIYIDDILLFSHDHQTHQQLLSDFLEIMQTHGIMLSEKKSNIGKEFIDFLGMVLKDDHYHPGPYIVVELLKFPDIDLTKKQIQQFLGIVNYVRDFIPKVAVHTSQLSCMLKKSSPPWGPAQTTTVKQLKKIAQSPPPLKIPTTGQRILQTDASDDFWSGILLDKIGDSESYCTHASGQFKDSEKNFHVIYKEILTVKYGIKKFEFHLVSHNFLIRMDNSSFPKIFDFKNKLLPDKQLLNLKTWFAKYDYTIQHIKVLFATKLVLPVRPTLRPYFQHPQTKDYWTQDMAYEWKTFPHPFRLDHDPTIISTLKAYLLELNNVQPVLTDIHHTSIGPSHTLEILPDTQICTPGSNSNPHGILV